jgi:hypothetical protein
MLGGPDAGKNDAADAGNALGSAGHMFLSCEGGDESRLHILGIQLEPSRAAALRHE